jgi:hypothetical protein
VTTMTEARAAARAAIAETINKFVTEDPRLRDDISTLFALVGKSYPFARKEPLLSAWRHEIRDARIEAFDRLPDGFKRPCPACRAKPGQACRSVGENDNLAAEFMAAAGQARQIRGNKAPGRQSETANRSVMHRVRIDADAPMHEVVSAA